MATPVLQFRRGAFSNLPALKAGEPGFTTDKYDLYVGLDNNYANNKFFGSHRYWTRETASAGSGINLVESTGGTDFITLAAPASVGAAVTFYFPATQGGASSVLTNDGSGNLSWGSGSANPVFSGIASFTGTTDNTLGNADTGAVQIDGGVGINKNLTVGQNLHVAGHSDFVGVVTFRGGTINIGDSNTDNINVGGEFISNLTPNDDNTYDIGIGTQRWKNANFAGVVTASTFSGALSGNASSADQVKTITASNTNATYHLTFVDSHNGSAINETVYTDDGIYYNPGTNTFTTQNALFTGNVEVQGTLTGTASTATRATTVDTTSTSTNADFFVPFVDTFAGENGETVRVGAGLSVNPSTGDVKVTGDLQIFGNDIKASDGNTNITLTSNTLTTFAGDIKVGGNDIQASDGTTAITLTAVTGAVGVSSDLTVSGKLFVLGTSTEINTETLKVEDSLIEVGLVNSGGSLVPPSSDLNIDVGIIFHYYTASAKKAGAFWDDSVSRVVVSSDLSESSSVITSSTYAALEIGSLWVTDCAGTSQVINCSSSERFLENITVDGGTF